MAGGGLSCLRCAFTCSVMALLGIGLHHDVEASPVICKKVGDTVELSSNLSSPEGVTVAYWQYEGTMLATIVNSEPLNPRFKGRVTINPVNFNLTVMDLTVEDSGDYQFLSETNSQSKTIPITLRVREPITHEPVVTFINSRWDPLNQSCTVFLECSVTAPSHVNFTWTVGGENRTGARLQHVLMLEDGAATFTCEASNCVSKMSASRSELCSNETLTYRANPSNSTIAVAAAAGGVGLVTLVLLGMIVGVCFFRRKQADGDVDGSTLYASITDISPQDTKTAPLTVYDTIHDVNTINPTGSQNPKPHSVYDEIQMHRMQSQTVSPYQ